MAYLAVVCRIQTRPHPNADRLALGTVKGYQVVVGKDTEDGQLGVFFAADGQLSEQMCEANNLIGYTDPETGEKKGGFFPKNRRVRSQKFRGEKSDGYWTTLDSLAFAGPIDLKEGDQFDELNGIPICNKYFTPATLKAQQAQAKQKKRENQHFAKHIETSQLKHEVDNIPEGSIIYVTEKLHGTSGRTGRVLETKTIPNGFFRKLFKRPERTETAYSTLLGTRNTILADHTVQGFYGSEEFRWNAVERIVENLRKGEVLYYELTGYTTTGQSIMSSHNTSELKDIKKKYGEQITYKYGQPEGTTGLHVYRITNVNEDGNVIELPWNQVKARCRELGINHVPEFNGPFIFDKSILMGLVEGLMEGPSTLDESHIREGVVIRVEKPDGTTDFHKSKSFSFGVCEGYLKNEDDYVDAEEIS